MDQRCKADRVLGNGNWEDYMWPHQIDKMPLLDPEVLFFLKRLDLSKLTGIFENEEVLTMGILFKLNDEDLNKLGIKLVHRKIILEELCRLKQQPTVKVQEKMTPIKSQSNESSASAAIAAPSPVRQQPMNDSPAVEKKSQVLSPPVTESPFLLITSGGQTADYLSGIFGLYRKTEEMREGRSVFMQESDSKYEDSPCKLFSNQGFWCMENYDGDVCLRAVTPSVSPKSAKWKFKEYDNSTWKQDPAITVTSLGEKPSVCEVTISLSKDVKRDIEKPGVVGLYKADGTYCAGRTVLKNEGGFILFVFGGCWWVRACVGGDDYLWSGTAPSQCPANPRAARNKSEERKHWKYWSKQEKWAESKGISFKCNKHMY